MSNNTITVTLPTNCVEFLNMFGALNHMTIQGALALIVKTRMDEARALTTSQPAHPDDLAVDRFADAMKAKLAASRAKGRGGWDDTAQCTVEHLARLLVDHIPKGDPVDVANFAMMLHQRGADRSVLAAQAQPAQSGDEHHVLCDGDIEELAIFHAPPIHPDFKDDDDFVEFGRAIERKVIQRMLTSLPTQPAAQATPEPSEAEAKQIIDELGMHSEAVQSLKRAGFEWNPRTAAWEKATQQAAGEPVGEPLKVEQCMQMASDEFDAFLIGGCKGEPPRMSMAFASTLFKSIIRERGMFFTHPAPAVPEGLDEDQLHTVERAADLLEHYAAFINEVKPDDIERHPYVPEIEMTAVDLRLLADNKRGRDA